MAENQTTTITVVDVVTREGAKDGRAWKKWGVKDEQGAFYSTFVPALGEKAVGLIGGQAVIEWKPSGDFKDLVSIEPVPGSLIDSRGPDGSADWDLIGLHKTRCALWAAFIESMLASNVFSGIDSQKPRVFELAQVGRQLVDAAVEHVYSDPPTTTDDVPF
jgi:hypothetical protein